MWNYMLALAAPLSPFLPGVHSQFYQQPAEVQSNNYQAIPGSPYYSQAADVINAAGFDPVTSQAVQVAVDFERSNWATGSVLHDPFYKLHPNASAATPGALLKVEHVTNTSSFTVPPNLALSRFLYQSETLNGSAVPVSAYVLWPWLPQTFNNVSGIPTVAFAHGTSGINSECAPSHIQNLWYQYSTPFTLALQGYAVVATDYAGLGINQTADATGQRIIHQWLASPAGANDVIYAVQAARQAFHELSKQFVVIGHSQGGGVAWAVAEREVSEVIVARSRPSSNADDTQPTTGYLGTVAVSPTTDQIERLKAPPAGTAPTLIQVDEIAEIFPEFQPSDWLTAEASKALQLYKDLGGCQSVRDVLLTNPNATYLKPGWNESWVYPTFNALTKAGGKPIAGPLLVLQGTSDNIQNPNVTNAVTTSTCTCGTQPDLSYVTFEGTTHIPTLYASQRIWLEWIKDRFMGRSTPGVCTKEQLSPARAIEDYQTELNYYLQRPEFLYEIGLGAAGTATCC